MKGSLYFVPLNGLGNRMRAMASACHLAAQTGIRLHTVWFKDYALNASFHEIFNPIPDMEVAEAGIIDKVLCMDPCFKNLGIPILLERILFQQTMDCWKVNIMLHDGIDFNYQQWVKGKRSKMSCFSEFGNPPVSLYPRLFKPVDSVKSEVERRINNFSSHTIGFHIRRTDNNESIANSPIRLFIEAGEREISEHDDTKIYLATDDQPTKRAMRSHFGDRVLISSRPSSRTSLEGILDGLADMYTLAYTSVIYGSYGSTFSDVAAKVSKVGTKLIILRNTY